MQATPSTLAVPSKLDQQRSNTSPRISGEGTGKWAVEDNEDELHPKPALAPTLTKNWTSLQEHADTVRGVSPAGGSTRRPEDRREGYVWEVPKDEELNDKWKSQDHPQTPVAPQTIKAQDFSDATPRISTTSTASSDIFEPPSFRKRASTAFSTASSIGKGRLSRNDTDECSTGARSISRNDTGRSSIGSIARGVMRHVPDIRMFASEEKKRRELDDHAQDEAPRQINKGGRRLSHVLTPALKRIGTDEKTTKRVTVMDGPNVKRSEPCPKGGLKDRRKLDQAEAMKLTLPIELPNLPPRRRMTMARGLLDIAPSRPRSPKTPWIRDTAPVWDTRITPLPIVLKAASPTPDPRGNVHALLPGNDPITSSVPPRFSEKPARHRRYLNRPHNKRGQSYNSENSITSLGAFAPGELQTEVQTPPINEPPPRRTTEELKEASKPKRRGRWRRSGPWTSSEAASADSTRPSHEGLDPRRSFSGLFRARKKNGHSSPPQSPLAQTGPQYQRTLSGPNIYGNALALANMPVPPSFVPPGLHRVPTPPIFDQASEVKGKLADFVFEMQDLEGVRRPKPSPGLPGRLWDSDALLMSQNSEITPHSSLSDESPSKLTPAGLTPMSLNDAARPNTPNSYVGSKLGPWATNLPMPTPTLPSRTLSNSLALPSFTPTTEHPAWFRVPLDADADPSNPNVRALREAEERAKFEWFTPEHLPSSPLCPLHPKYRGPSTGVCVFHGRQEKARDSRGSRGSRDFHMDGESPADGMEGTRQLWARGFLAQGRKRVLSMSSS